MTLGSHQSTIGRSQVYITPRWILDPLGRFDTDPCAADPQPWACATRGITEPEDGLSVSWHDFGRVWLNPPFDRRVVGQFMRKMAQHGNGVALVHARTETEWFLHIWDNADAILFLAGRVVFCRPDGTPSRTESGLIANSGAPVVLAAFGSDNVKSLASSGLAGSLVTDWRMRGAA